MQKNEEKISISYSTENVENVDNQPILNSNADWKAQQFIAESCQKATKICQSSEFKELKTELDKLNIEKVKIEAEIKRFGESEELVDAQIKIENQRANITKELVGILMS